MKIIKLNPDMNELQVDRYCANHNLAIVRFLPGKVKSQKRSLLGQDTERKHVVLVTEIRA